MTRWLSGIAVASVVALMGAGCAEDEAVSAETGKVDGQIKGTWCLLTREAGAATGFVPFKNPVTHANEILTIAAEGFVWVTKDTITADQGFYAKDGGLGDSILGLSNNPRYWYSLANAPGGIQAQALCIQSQVLHTQKPAAGELTLETADDVFCRAADTTLWQ